MNSSKLYEWLLDNDCPFDFDVQDSYWEPNSCTVVFTEFDKEEA